jgi:hypothetical protein
VVQRYLPVLESNEANTRSNINYSLSKTAEFPYSDAHLVGGWKSPLKLGQNKSLKFLLSKFLKLRKIGMIGRESLDSINVPTDQFAKPLSRDLVSHTDPQFLLR